MQVGAQDVLDMVEQTGRLAFFDIEAMGLRGDYNSVLCVSIKPYGEKPVTFTVTRPGDDMKVLKAAKAQLEKSLVWCGYFSKMFDIPMLNTRLLRHSIKPIEKRHHIDLYFTLKHALLTARKSQGHLLSWLQLPEEKMTVSASDWADAPKDWAKIKPTMVKRCESDVTGLEALYRRTRHLIADVTR